METTDLSSPTKPMLSLAPLQGYTDAPYRNAISAVCGGIDTYYTPFVRLERGDIRSRDRRDVTLDNNTVSHLIPQLIASEPEEMKFLIDFLIEKGYHEIDLNWGCPFPLLAKRKKGAGLLPYPDKVEELLTVLKSYQQVTFSVKMRLGWQEADEALRLLPLLNNAPLHHITLHPRLGIQQYKGDVDLDAFARFAEACKLPLHYNGDLMNLADIQKIQTLFPSLAGVMIGRGILANPLLGMEYRQGSEFTEAERMAKIKELHTIIYQHYLSVAQGDTQLMAKMHAFWEYLQPRLEIGSASSR